MVYRFEEHFIEAVTVPIAFGYAMVHDTTWEKVHKKTDELQAGGWEIMHFVLCSKLGHFGYYIYVRHPK